MTRRAETAAEAPGPAAAGREGAAAKRAAGGARVTGWGVLLPWGRGGAALARPAAAGMTGRIANFNPREHIHSAKALRAMPRGFQLTAAAAGMALEAAGMAAQPEGLAAAGLAPERAGVVIAAADLNPVTPDLVALLAAGAVGEAFGEAALHGLHPFRRLHLLTNMAAAHISILFGFQGPSLTLTSGAAAAGQALEEAVALLAEGRAEAVLCAASDCPEQTIGGGAGSRGEEAAAGVLLERADAAMRRGAAGPGLRAGAAGAEWARRFPVCGALLAAAARAAADGGGAALGPAEGEEGQ